MTGSISTLSQIALSGPDVSTLLVDRNRDRLDNLKEALADPESRDASLKSIQAFKDELGARVEQPNHLEGVPKLFHFIYGFHSSGDIPFYGYLAIQSALHFNPGWKAILYCMHLPEGPNWDRISRSITVIKVEPFDFFLNARFLHYAHKADVIRLIAINQVGGIYLDLDTITQRSFGDLLDVDFCMGVQAAGPNSASGLCNAVMIGRPGAEFSTQWLQQYDSFRSLGRDDLWDYHSVKLPGILMAQAPETITVLGYRAFFYPLWETVETVLFTERNLVLRESLDVVYCFHLWNGSTGKMLNSLDESYIRNAKSIYAAIGRLAMGIDE